MPQLSFDIDPAVGYAGMSADNGPKDIVSGMAASRKQVSIAVTADNSQDFTVTINGTDFTYSSDASATTAEIVAGLVALIDAGDEPVDASGTDTPLILTSTIDGEAGDFTLALAAGGAGDLVATTLIAQSQAIGFGKAVILDPAGSHDRSVRLPFSNADLASDRGMHVGLAIEDRAREENAEAFVANTMIPVALRGRFWVQVEEAVTKNSLAYIRYAAGGNGPGSFGASTGSSERTLVERFIYRTSAAQNGLAIVELF